MEILVIIINYFKMKYFIIAGLILFFACGYGQKKTEVSATGKYEARDLTLEQVKNKAIDEAKKNAMAKAGIAENVTVTDFLYTFEDNDKFKEIFQSFVSTETGAEIVVDKVRELNRDINEFGNILIEVEIEATIFKHKKEKDPEFQFRVEGIREFYYNNDGISFSFLPSMEGYLRIFNITDDTAFVLYPYSGFENPVYNDAAGRKFANNTEVQFPVNEHLDKYYFEIDDPTKGKEYNLLIFVYTKSNIPFLEDETVENIMRWIYEIPLDQRAVEQFGIIVNR